jgi:hypothetical protein
MNTRIRYKKRADGKLESTTFFVTTNNNVRVVLSNTDLTFHLIDIENGEVIAAGKANNINALKNEAKRKLESLGVIFKTEKRERLESVKNELRQMGVDV